MHSTFEPNQAQVTFGQPTPELYLQVQEDSPQRARVSAAQQLLFPSSPRSLCDEIGLAWQTAVHLEEQGWLSFSLDRTPHLDEAEEAELRFVGGLVLAGCDSHMLGVLLASLPRPYAYDLQRIYYDWNARRWRLLPDPRAHPESAFTDWLELLVQSGDAASLVGILELAQDALLRVERE